MLNPPHLGSASCLLKAASWIGGGAALGALEVSMLVTWCPGLWCRADVGSGCSSHRLPGEPCASGRPLPPRAARSKHSAAGVCVCLPRRLQNGHTCAWPGWLGAPGSRKGRAAGVRAVSGASGRRLVQGFPWGAAGSGLAGVTPVETGGLSCPPARLCSYFPGQKEAVHLQPCLG